MLNRFVGIGRWAKENEMRYSAQGTAILGNTIAMNDKFNKDNTTFLPVVMFKKTAENTAQFTSKGSLVAVEGRIQVRSWEKDGQKRYSTEVVADSVQFLENKNQSGQQSSPQQNSAPQNDDPFKDGSKEIDSDSLPF